MGTGTIIRIRKSIEIYMKEYGVVEILKSKERRGKSMHLI